MEKVTVKSKSIKKGENEKGEWVNTRITGEDGQKWSGFDKNLQYLNEGDVIEITEIEIKGQNKNILKWHKVEAAQVQPGNGKTVIGKTSDQFDIERRSYESQTAFKGAIQLLEAGAVWPDRFNAEIEELVHSAIRWGRISLDVTTPTQTATRAPESSIGTAKSASTDNAIGSGHFENAGQFLAACNKQFGLNRSQIMAELNVKDPAEIKNLDEAWVQIVAVRKP